MQITVNGIVIKEKNIDEDDRLLWILTKDKGVISAYAKGAKRIKSSMASSTEFLCYSRFVIFRNRDRHWVDKADSNNVFFGVRGDIEKLALASYIAQLTAELVPEGECSEEYLRLVLNTLHMLDKNLRSAALLKPLFELRLLSMSGYMPDLVACRGCRCYTHDAMHFSPLSGELSCPNCLDETPMVDGVAVPPSVLAAMRHIIYIDFEKLFNFSLPDEHLKYLSWVGSQYLKARIEKNLPALDFYETIMLDTPVAT